MADLGAYLSRKYGVVIADEIIAHLLWAVDLILFSDTQHGIQKQLHGLQRFCANNHMIVNETKTKIVCFGRPIKCNVHFNGKIIEQVDSYKYLGNVIRSVQICDQDVYFANYHYLCDQSRKAIFSIRRKLKCLRTLPATVMFYLFDALIRPILTYGSDVWGYSKAGMQVLDKLFLNYVRCALHIKATTCIPIVYGECRRFPPSIYCHINILCYYHRLLMMSENKITKSVFIGSHKLHRQGVRGERGRYVRPKKDVDERLSVV